MQVCRIYSCSCISTQISSIYNFNTKKSFMMTLLSIVHSAPSKCIFFVSGRKEGGGLGLYSLNNSSFNMPHGTIIA